MEKSDTDIKAITGMRMPLLPKLQGKATSMQTASYDLNRILFTTVKVAL